MSDQDKSSKSKLVTMRRDWRDVLLAFGVFTLSLTILGNLDQIITLTGIARWIRDHWSLLGISIADLVSTHLHITIRPKSILMMISMGGALILLISARKRINPPPGATWFYLTSWRHLAGFMGLFFFLTLLSANSFYPLDFEWPSLQQLAATLNRPAELVITLAYSVGMLVAVRQHEFDFRQIIHRILLAIAVGVLVSISGAIQDALFQLSDFLAGVS